MHQRRYAVNVQQTATWASLGMKMSVEDLKKLSEPRWMRCPRWSGHQLAVHNGIKEVQRHKGSACQLYLWRAGRIGVQCASLQNSSRG